MIVMFYKTKEMLIQIFATAGENIGRIHGAKPNEDESNGG